MKKVLKYLSCFFVTLFVLIPLAHAETDTVYYKCEYYYPVVKDGNFQNVNILNTYYYKLTVTNATTQKLEDHFILGENSLEYPEQDVTDAKWISYYIGSPAFGINRTVNLVKDEMKCPELCIGEFVPGLRDQIYPKQFDCPTNLNVKGPIEVSEKYSNSIIDNIIDNNSGNNSNNNNNNSDNIKECRYYKDTDMDLKLIANFDNNTITFERIGSKIKNYTVTINKCSIENFIDSCPTINRNTDYDEKKSLTINYCHNRLKQAYIGDTSCGGLTFFTFPKIWPQITSTLYTLIKILVPVILIFKGMLDMFKAATAQKEDEMKKAQKKFVQRLMAGGLALLAFIIVETVINLIAVKTGNKGAINCMNCFINNKCETYEDSDD